MNRKIRSVMDSYVASNIEWWEFELQQGRFLRFLFSFILFIYVFILSFALEYSFNFLFYLFIRLFFLSLF